MIRRRFLPLRGIKIVAWTLAGVAWTTAILANRVAAAPTQTTEESTTATQPQAAAQLAPLPATPSGGLVVVKVGPAKIAPPPTKTIVRRVIQAPTRQASSGS